MGKFRPLLTGNGETTDFKSKQSLEGLMLMLQPFGHLM